MLQGSKSEQISGIRIRKSSTVCKSTPALSSLMVQALIAWRTLHFSNHPFEALKSAMTNWLADYNALLCRIGPESGMTLSRAWRNQFHIRSFRLSCLLLFQNVNIWTFSLFSKLARYSDLRFKIMETVILPTPNFSLKYFWDGFWSFHEIKFVLKC